MSATVLEPVTRASQQASQRAPRSRVLTGIRIAVRALRIGTITLVFVAVLLSVCVFALSATNTARVVPVLSDSMAPSMPVGSVALTLPVARASVRAGDVIVFSDPLEPAIRVIHRVTHVFTATESSKFSNWSSDKIFLSTKGDNNTSADPWVVTIADATVWKQTGSVPAVGYAAIWIANPTLRLVLFLGGGVAVALWALVALWRRPVAARVAS